MKNVLKLSEWISIITTILILGFGIKITLDATCEEDGVFCVQDKVIRKYVHRDSTLTEYLYIVNIEDKEYTILNYPQLESYDKIQVGNKYKFSKNRYGGIWLINK